MTEIEAPQVFLTERERDVLDNLRGYTDSANRAGVTADEKDAWARVMDCGGRDASHHSGTLRRLANRGLCEKRFRGGYCRRTWLYRINDAGRAALAKVNGRK